MRTPSPAVYLSLIVLAGAAIYAQTAPAFEVATIRLSPPEAQGALLTLPQPGRLSVTNFTLRMLINQAYGPEMGQGFQITGGPSWIEKDRYVILGQAPATTPRAELNTMLKNLLIDRFKLKTHADMKEVDAYALVVARKDGKLGEGLRKWDGTCNGKEPPPAQPNSTGPRCSAFFRPPGMFMRGVPMGVLANMLSAPIANLGRPVIDRTSLTGEFDFDLAVTFAPASPNAATSDNAPPSVFVALQEQLGLKLEPTKATVKVLVIDSAEHPTEN